MAATFTAYFNGIIFAATKNMGAVLNLDATEIIKIRRVGLLNSQVSAVTGQLAPIEFRAYFAGSPALAGSTAVTPIKHDSSSAFPANATIGFAGTPSGTAAILRRIFWSSDEPAITGGTLDEFETFVPLNVIWDAGYADTNVQKLTLRQDQMCLVWSLSATAGLLDSWFEFTIE